MREGKFHFKRFSVSHHRSSMKIGVDAVLIGAWAQGDSPERILDVGTGCGVIAMMMAQRYPGAEVTGIDIDEASIQEARENFRNSEMNERLEAEQIEFPKDIAQFGTTYDLIVSNPPYFDSGVTSPTTSREKARHQSTLSMFSLIQHSRALLTPKGRLSMIFPTEFRKKVMDEAVASGFSLIRECFVRDNEGVAEKRVMMEFGLDKHIKPEEEHLTLFKDGNPTEAHRNLCGDFYLKF